MPIFTYRAKNFNGETTTGTREVKNKRELAILLKTDGYILVSALEAREALAAKPKSFTFSIPFLTGRVSIEEKMMFSRNLAVMIKAGLSLTRALAILEKQTESQAFKTIIASLNESVSKGNSFADSISQHQHIFPPMFIAMVSAGETSGKLDEALGVLAIQLKNDYELRRKIKGALIYPGVIITAMILIGTLMMVYIVPTLVQTFKDLGVELPKITLFIISLSNAVIQNGIWILLALPVLAVGLVRFLQLPRTKYILDIVLVHIPVIRGINKKMNAARTARTLSSLLTAGVPILKALEITTDVIQNHLYKVVLVEAQAGIQKGQPISQSFIAHTDTFPVLVGEMIAVGEETGKTSDMLHRLALFYEREVAAATKDLSSIIEPVLMIIVGVVVGLFAVSMIQPLYGSLQQIGMILGSMRV